MGIFRQGCELCGHLRTEVIESNSLCIRQERWIEQINADRAVKTNGHQGQTGFVTDGQSDRACRERKAWRPAGYGKQGNGISAATEYRGQDFA